MTDDVTEETLTDSTADHSADHPAEHSAASGDGPAPQYGVGPFSIREMALVGVWLLAFIVSFFSLSTLRFDSVWTAGLLWILTIAAPSVAVFLLILRRLSPDGIRRVGSLGIDQFASVAFSVSALLWLQLVWETVAFVVADGPWVRSWVMWVEFVLMLIGVVLTVFAPIIPVIGDDFRDRREVTAHRNARPIRPVVARPKPEPRPARQAQEPVDAEYAANPFETGAFDTGPQPTGAYAATPYDAAAHDTGGYDADAWAPQHRDDRVAQPVHAAAEPATQLITEPAPAPQPVSQQPFWALAPTERDVYDAQGSPLFRIGPTAWALVIEDRGSVYIVRHEDGRIGYLHDVSGVTRG